MSNKFKIGDRVRLVSGVYHTTHEPKQRRPVGYVGTVTSIEDNYWIRVDGDKNGQSHHSWELVTEGKFKAGDKVRCIDNSYMGHSGGGPRPEIGEVFEVANPVGRNHFHLKGRIGTWDMKNWELVTTPEIKVGDKVTMSINSPLYDIVAHTSVMEVTSISSDYIYVRTPLNGQIDGWNRKYFTLYEGPKRGDKGTIEVTYVRDNRADPNLGVFQVGSYEVHVPKDTFTITKKASPPKPKRELPGLNTVINYEEGFTSEAEA